MRTITSCDFPPSCLGPILCVLSNSPALSASWRPSVMIFNTFFSISSFVSLSFTGIPFIIKDVLRSYWFRQSNSFSSNSSRGMNLRLLLPSHPICVPTFEQPHFRLVTSSCSFLTSTFSVFVLGVLVARFFPLMISG